MEKLFGILSSDTIDISLRRSAAEQLTIVLQGRPSVTKLTVEAKVTRDLSLVCI